MPWICNPAGDGDSQLVHVYINDEDLVAKGKASKFNGKLGMLFHDAEPGVVLHEFFIRLFLLENLQVGGREFLHKPFSAPGRRLQFEKERFACYYEVDEQCFWNDALDIIGILTFEAPPGYSLFMPQAYWDMVRESSSFITAGICNAQDNLRNYSAENPDNRELSALVKTLDDNDLKRQVERWRERRETK